MVDEFLSAVRRAGATYQIKDGCIIADGGSVYLSSLTALPEGTSFTNGGDVDLSGLTALPEGTSFTNGRSVYLSSLTALPEGTSFTNGGSVYLRSLTALPEGTSFTNGGSVDLGSLPSGEYSYQDQIIRLECVDGYTMLVNSARTMGEYEVLSCRYFGGGDLEKLKRVYVARTGEYSAHGNTASEAIRDCRFKAMQANFDATELIETIKARGTIQFNDFRLLTGACAEGLRHGMEEVGLPADTEELPLGVALKVAHGSFGAAFKRAFEQ
jgi:hypothetical protein